MMKYPVLGFPFVLFLLLVMGCHQKKSDAVRNSNISVIPVNFDVCTRPDDYYSAFVSNIEVVPLETPAGAELGGIMHFMVQDSIIFIHQKDKPIYVFTLDGRFVRKIGEIGEGPGKFEINNDFFVEDTVVYISSYSSVEKFSVNGHYLGSIDINHWLQSEQPFYSSLYRQQGDYAYIYSGGRNTDYHLYVFTSGGKLLSRKFPNQWLQINFVPRFIVSEDEMYLLPVNCVDTIFKLSQGMVSPAWFLDFGNHGNPSLDDLPKGKTEVNDLWKLMDYCTEKKRVHSINGFGKNRQHVFFRFSLAGQVFHGYYDTISGLSQTIKYTDPPEVFNPFTIAQGFFVHKDKLFMFVDAYIIRKALQKGKNTCTYLSDDQQNKILMALKNVGEYDNPLLYIIKLK